MIAPLRPLSSPPRDASRRRAQVRRARNWVIRNFLTPPAPHDAPRTGRFKAWAVCGWLIAVAAAWCGVMVRGYLFGR